MTIDQPTLSIDPRRPRFHFSPAQGWMNDPNGLVYYAGEYHLFYQHYPDSTHWSTMHWGHAVSPDLVHWQHLPIALYPDTNGAIFSGSVVVDAANSSGFVPGGGLVAVFSYENQSQGIAYSRDHGRSWTMYPGNPVIASPGGDFRDPKVFWHEATACWIMVIAAHDRVKLYRSLNLIEWRSLSEFGQAHGAHGGVWECPDLFPMTVDGLTKWVLLVSIGDDASAGGSGTQYFIGSFDGVDFTSDYPITLWLDYGQDNYAGVTWNNLPDGRRLFIGWMNNWAYAHEIRASIWNGIMTLPRELSLCDVQGVGLRIAQKPVPELDSLRGQSVVMRAVTISDEAELEVAIQENSMEITAEFEIGTASEFGFKVLKSGEGEHFTRIGYHVADETLFIDRRSSGEVDFHAAFAGVCRAPLKPTDGFVRMHLFIDRSTIEVFSTEVLSALVFPLSLGESLGLYAVNGEVRLSQLEIYPLRSVWS